MTTSTSRESTAEPFHTTRWTRVCLAKADSEDGRKALADLCDAYYEPVVAYLRSVFRDGDAAREMGHAFFAETLGGGTIRGVERERGRFRGYLLGAVKHFVSRQREMAQSLKRGGGSESVSLDDEDVSDVPDRRSLSPDAEFDRQWAITVLERAMEALRAACQVEGRADFFETVRPLLMGDSVYGDQGSFASACGMKIEAFRVAVHRLKKRLRQCVKAEVAATLDDPASVQDEMQTLFAALGG